MDLSSEKERLITQLIRETTSGNISWSVQEVPYSLGQATENYVPLYIEADYKNVKVGVYEIRYKYYMDESEFHWMESLGICIVQGHGLVVWKVEEYSPALKELFNIASYQASGIKNILGI
ncbi:hypothetical protein [Methylomagnum ishizawai]|uniref:hypothetical protein n=1 Tax=Methylomagnum ishizawai TaxID=1760988 RepID=UPI000A14F6FE|nr:hypothetical protein [Methylomagnum ishizawai]